MDGSATMDMMQLGVRLIVSWMRVIQTAHGVYQIYPSATIIREMYFHALPTLCIVLFLQNPLLVLQYIVLILIIVLLAEI